jgi:hypothetical protein
LINCVKQGDHVAVSTIEKGISGSCRVSSWLDIAALINAGQCAISIFVAARRIDSVQYTASIGVVPQQFKVIPDVIRSR